MIDQQRLFSGHALQGRCESLLFAFGAAIRRESEVVAFADAATL